MTEFHFVCLGNICRSPMAEAIAHQEIIHRNLPEIISSSSGTANYHVGQSPDPRTMQVLQLNNIHFQHSGRQFQYRDFHPDMWIFPMDIDNEKNVRRLSSDDFFQSRIILFRDLTGKKGLEVPDPYYGDLKDFKNVFSILSEGMQAIFDCWELNSTFHIDKLKR